MILTEISIQIWIMYAEMCLQIASITSVGNYRFPAHSVWNCSVFPSVLFSWSENVDGLMGLENQFDTSIECLSDTLKLSTDFHLQNPHSGSGLDDIEEILYHNTCDTQYVLQYIQHDFSSRYISALH